MRLVRNGSFAVTVGLVSLFCMAGSASAASSPFGCRASVARVGLLGSTVLEPLIANSGSTPCADDTRGVTTVSVPTTGSASLNAGPAAAYTAENSTPAAAALTSVDGVTIPTTSGGSIVVVGPVYDEATYECVNGNVVGQSSSTLDLLYIDGTRVTLTPGENETLQLGGGSYVSVNETIKTADSLTERLLDVHLAGLADIVVGEAVVSRPASNPCTSSSTGPPTPIVVCPKGSVFNVAAQLCEITLPGGTVIVIGPPFKEPTGGTVIPLSEARKLYHSPCLWGAGPNYVIVGTNKANVIHGTLRAERILGLGGNDQLYGGGGADCIDGGAGNDLIREQDGNARLYGAAGNDRIFLRNGNMHVYGGTGHNKISAGRGSDVVHGGAFATIYVDNGPKQVFSGTKGGKVFAPGARDAIHCSTKHDRVNVNMYAARYATHHGCTKVHRLRPAVL